MLQALFGNVREIPVEQANEEFAAFLIDSEQITKAYVLIRDLLVFTNLRILSLDKEGLTGSKQTLTTIPYASIRRFSRVGAGFLDLSAELHIWVAGDAQPLTFKFAKGADINEVYQHLSHYVLTQSRGK